MNREKFHKIRREIRRSGYANYSALNRFVAQTIWPDERGDVLADHNQRVGIRKARNMGDFRRKFKKQFCTGNGWDYIIRSWG